MLWHRGRCLPYGEGVAFWALGRDGAGARRHRRGGGRCQGTAKLAAAVERYVADPRERRLVEPRLPSSSGSAERGQADRAGLFSAWRTWVERLGDARPTVMVFEDIQWADQGLLDFIEHLIGVVRRAAAADRDAGPSRADDRRPGWAEAADASG